MRSNFLVKQVLDNGRWSYGKQTHAQLLCVIPLGKKSKPFLHNYMLFRTTITWETSGYVAICSSHVLAITCSVLVIFDIAGVLILCCSINTLRLRQDGFDFADIFTYNFSNENRCILIIISMKYVHKGLIDNDPVLAEPALPEPMMA